MGIFDKMLRVAGRSPSGVARAIKTDEKGSVSTQILGSASKRGEELPQSFTAYPKNTLKVSKIVNTATYGFGMMPKSVGLDGNLYGVRSDLTLYRTLDGHETVETGAKMDDITGWIAGQGVSRMFQTYAGYVVIATHAAGYKASIWFSTSFTSGFTMVANLDRGAAGNINISAYNKGFGQTVILVGEYVMPAPVAGQECRLFASFDGGATFNVIHTLPAKDPTVNNHYHATVYDPYDSRIYASSGDAQNAALYYSDDLGVTWSTIDALYKGLHQQPTLMMAFPDKIATGPDRSTAPVVLSLYKDRQFDLPNTEKFRYELDYAIFSKTASTGASSYSFSPYAQDGVEAYFTVPGSKSRPLMVVGTGDGGNTWHKVFTINLAKTASGAARDGIIGPDKNGLMYLPFRDTGGKIAILEKAQWVSQSTAL